ncbi:hypothetical protein Q5N85_19605, partial [Acinetobacter baumannii]|nr:hypothetical protein [Acinetobacter baumannii]
VDDYIYIPGIRAALERCCEKMTAWVIRDGAPVGEISLYMESLTAEEREIIKAGSLINFNRARLTP